MADILRDGARRARESEGECGEDGQLGEHVSESVVARGGGGGLLGFCVLTGEDGGSFIAYGLHFTLRECSLYTLCAH